MKREQLLNKIKAANEILEKVGNESKVCFDPVIYENFEESMENL